MSESKKLINIHQRRLQKLREQQALFGLNTPAEILIEIEEIEAQIRRLQAIDVERNDYLHNLRHQIAPQLSASSPLSESLDNPSQIFLPVACKVHDFSEGPIQDAFDYLGQRIEDTPVMLVLGDYGSGKSFLIRKFLLKYINLFNNKDFENRTSRLPVYYHLSDFYGVDHDLIVRKLVSRLNEYGDDYNRISNEEFLEMCRNGELLCMLDGFDEIPLLMLYSEPFQKLMQILNVLNTGENRIVITSRPGVFIHEIQQEELIKLVQIMHILPWNEDMFLKYLVMCEGIGWHYHKGYSGFNQLIQKTPTLLELTSKPLFCRMLVETSDKINTKNASEIDVSELYNLYISNHLQKDITRSPIKDVEAKIEMMTATATGMLEQNRINLTSDELNATLSKHAQSISSHKLRDFATQDATNYTLLISSWDNKVAFSHKSFYEYFVARKGHEELLHLADSPPKILADYKLSTEIIKFLAGFLKKQSAIDAVENLSRVFQKDDDRHGYISNKNPLLTRNLFLLLVAHTHIARDIKLPSHTDLTDININGLSTSAKLLGIGFDGINCAGADFRHITLKNSSFVESKLNRCLFDGADLCEVDFSDADLQGISCRDARFYGACFEDAIVRQADTLRIISAIYNEAAEDNHPNADAWITQTVQGLQNLALPD